MCTGRSFHTPLVPGEPNAASGHASKKCSKAAAGPSSRGGPPHETRTVGSDWSAAWRPVSSIIRPVRQGRKSGCEKY